MQKRLTLALLAVAVPLAGCGVIESIPGAEHLMPREYHENRDLIQAAVRTQERLTPEQAYHLGRAVSAEILTRYSVYPDEQATRYLNQVGSAIASASDMPYVYNGYRFVILDSDEVNAFAVPGAYIFVTRGLLQCCTTEDELAAVLAHEIGHIQAQHAMKTIESSRWAELTGLLAERGISEATNGQRVGQLSSLMSDMAKDVSRKLMVNGYSRDAEKQADAIAVTLMERVGYDPSALVSMLERMDQRLPAGSGGFGATHPPAAQRAQWARSSTGSAAETPPPAQRQQRFQEAMAGLRS